jgi:hypothetical protein
VILCSTRAAGTEKSAAKPGENVRPGVAKQDQACYTMLSTFARWLVVSPVFRRKTVVKTLE